MRRPIPLMSVFSFVQQVARYEATYPPHVRISISCNKLHAMRGWIPLMCVFHLSCRMHLDARPIHLMSVFPFRAINCTLRGDISISCAYFHFVQQVARYEATYPLHASVFIRATRYMKCGEWSFDIVYFR